MIFLDTLLSPTPLLFFIILAGILFGKARIYKISVGIAGVLFVAILLGALLNNLLPPTYNATLLNIQSTLKTFSKLGSALFISVIGLEAGFSTHNGSQKTYFAFIIGAIMSAFGVMTMLLISAMDKSIGLPTLLGILSGALTSSPALSLVSEALEKECQAATLGYSGAYILGVILTVFFSKLFSGRNENFKSDARPTTIKQSKPLHELTFISISAVLGSILGALRIPLLNVSIGSTACILLIGWGIGFAYRKILSNASFSSLTLNTFKTLGLALFFAGNGFSCGASLTGFDIKIVLYGAIITIVSIICGYLLCKLVFKCLYKTTGFITAGGMTSSPAYGAISSKANDECVSVFSFSYLGALFSLMIALQIILK